MILHARSPTGTRSTYDYPRHWQSIPQRRLTHPSREAGSYLEPSGFGDALLNLALNSAQAMNKALGHLVIEASNVVVEGNELTHVTDLVGGEYVVVTCSDDGSGIPADLLDKVFEPFFTTKERTRGSGLGLSMVYGFCRRCGGTARIYSEPGRGTTVRLYLPRAKGVAVEARPISINAIPRGRQETILMVDDEAGFLRAASQYLGNLGYKVLTAETPNKAMEYATGGKQIHLLFSDVVMPGPVNGIQLASALHEIVPHLKVLLTTGFADGAQLPGNALSRFPILQKPYRLDELASRIHALLSETVE